MDKSQETQTNQVVVQRQVHAESVSKAIYVVTDLFEKDEPMRSNLRSVAVQMIASVDKRHAGESSRRLYTLVKMAKDIKLISEMNAELILKAISGLDIYTGEFNGPDITNVLDVKSAEKNGDDELSTVLESVVVVKDIPNPLTIQKRQEEKLVAVVPKDRTLSTGNPATDIGSRRKKILEIVKNKGQVTINEFIAEIQGCSSKTIQRELTSLVLSGTLKKAGERRWSKYSLK